MGANTYIGNGPNFMVKAIAEEAGYPMPTFFGYAGRALLTLAPVYVAFVWLIGLGWADARPDRCARLAVARNSQQRARAGSPRSPPELLRSQVARALAVCEQARRSPRPITRAADAMPSVPHTAGSRNLCVVHGDADRCMTSSSIATQHEAAIASNAVRDRVEDRSDPNRYDDAAVARPSAAERKALRAWGG